MTTKLRFFTEFKSAGWYGRCRENPSLSYGPKLNRSTALSGVKRLAKGLSKTSAARAAPSSPPPTTSGYVQKVLQKKVNRVALVIDRSGSMASLTKAAVKALNDNLTALRNEAAKTGQRTEAVVLDFNNVVRTIRYLQDVENIAPITESEVYASGGTALFDAVGDAITKLGELPVKFDQDMSYLVMTVTDGEENSSHRFKGFLPSLMKRVQATDRWTLTFLVPVGHTRTLVGHGIPAGNVQEWEQTQRGVEDYARQNTRGIASYYQSRSVGQNSLKSFYHTTDLSGVTAKQIKGQLDDISALVKVLPVDKEVDIRTFVEGKTNRPYQPGSAFYQLTKDEKKVQDYKQLLVMEKGKRAVYGGPDARQVLGIPDGELKIKPGNHGNFDIFVQSNSLNRKLVRGTKLLVKTN